MRKRTKNIPCRTGHSEKSSILLLNGLVSNKCNGAVVMSPDSEGLGATVVSGVGSKLTQRSGI